MKELISMLTQHYVLLEELYKLMQRETDALANVHLETMAEINLQKENVAGRIQAQIPLLQQAMVAAALQERLPERSTLGEIANRMKKRGQKELPKLHADINALAAKINNAAELNRDIAQRFADTVNQSLEFISRLLKQSNFYGASGGYQQRQTGAIMINMEA